MDEIIKNNIQLKYKGIPTRIDLVQYTNAMRLVFVLTDYPMPSGATARIYVKKPSGKEVYNVATISGDTVTVSTTTQMTAEAGTNNAQLQIVKGSIVAASFVFCLHVQPNIAEDTAIESSNEYGVLDGLIADANNLIDQARATLGGITPINNLTSTDASKPLAAPMGKLLDDKISSLNADLTNRVALGYSGNASVPVYLKLMDFKVPPNNYVFTSSNIRIFRSTGLLSLCIRNGATGFESDLSYFDVHIFADGKVDPTGSLFATISEQDSSKYITCTLWATTNASYRVARCNVIDVTQLDGSGTNYQIYRNIKQTEDPRTSAATVLTVTIKQL